MIGSFKATSPQPRRKVALNGSCWETAVMRSKALTSAGLVSFLAAPLTCWQLWASHLSQPHLLICKLTSMSVPSSWSCFWVGGQGEKWEALNTGPGIQILFELFLLKKKKKKVGTSLVAQWLRIRLAMQGTWVQSLVREPTFYMGGSN